MGLPKNVFAYTAPGADYPEYLSLNVVDGKVLLTVRGPKRAPGVGGNDKPFDMAGSEAVIELPRAEVLQLADKLAEHLDMWLVARPIGAR